MNRKRLTLLILLIVLVLSVGYSYLKTPQLKTVEKLKFAPGAAASVPKTEAGTKGDRLRLDLLKKENATFAGYRKNIFRPIFRESAPRGAALLPKQVKLIPPPPPPAPPHPVIVEAAPLPSQAEIPKIMARFTFLGFLQKDGRKTIFLSKDKDIFVVKQGDRLAGSFTVSSINDDAITIHVQDDGSEIVIPLVENKPLTPRMR